MNNFELTQSEILSIYKETSDSGKKILDDKFGKDKFSSKIEDRIWSLKDACLANGTPIEDAIPYPTPKNEKQRCVNAFSAKIEFVQAFNESVIPDWKNSMQYKYTNWYYLNGCSGFGLSFFVVHCADSHTRVASRLYFLKESHSKLFYERFPEIEQQLMTQKNN